MVAMSDLSKEGDRQEATPEMQAKKKKDGQEG